MSSLKDEIDLATVLEGLAEVLESLTAARADVFPAARSGAGSSHRPNR